MKRIGYLIVLVLLIGTIYLAYATPFSKQEVINARIISTTIDPIKQTLKFYWKNENGQRHGNFEQLKTMLHKANEKLVFAMNGGMYTKEHQPQGLFIEQGKLLTPIDSLKDGYGNFYMQPNGIFYITDHQQTIICKTEQFFLDSTIQYATQSGPMLLIDGNMHPKFNKGSSNLHIRNGVGILPNGQVLFAMSKELINFYDFATYFKEQGCQNALYLDGFVSRTYLPAENWEQLDGNFGVIIAVTETIK